MQEFVHITIALIAYITERTVMHIKHDTKPKAWGETVSIIVGIIHEEICPTTCYTNDRDNNIVRTLSKAARARRELLIGAETSS